MLKSKDPGVTEKLRPDYITSVLRSKVLLLGIAFFISTIAFGCTNLIVTRGASKDSATYLVYLNDGEWLYHLDKTPPKDHSPGDSLSFTSLSGKTSKIHQVPHTYGIIGFLMNEYQLAIGESTFTGREELWDKDKPLKYWELMRLALLRARNAREAIEVITSLTEVYGYGSEGESISIADPNEAWILEIIGTGGKGGAVWVAIKIPDGSIAAHANHARIGQFPLNDPENCLYSDNIFEIAIERGYYDPEAGVPFRFNEAYDPSDHEKLRYSETRVWSIFRRAAPSRELPPDYHRGKEGSAPYPLYIEPDDKLDIRDIFSLVRDHYEGTPYDMTTSMSAGPFGSPNRPRPLGWELQDENYSFERPVSTYNTAFSYVAQLRNYLPDEIGGIAWYGVDDTYTSCYFPLYCQVTDIPGPFASGDINRYSRDNAWWAFNFAANYANLRYRDMVRDIVLVQQEIEGQFFNDQDSIEQYALTLSPSKRLSFLNEYSNVAGRLVHSAWVALGDYLVMKYNDGYVKDSSFYIHTEGYPEDWLKTISGMEKAKYIIPD